jgi:hypothetical protein
MNITSLDVLSEHINTDSLNMNPFGGDNSPGSGGTTPRANQSGGTTPRANQGGGPNPGPPGWRPYAYLAHIREDGGSYPMNNTSPASVLQTYDPAGSLPVQSDRQLGVLIDYRFEHYVRAMGYSNWNVANIFPSNSMTDEIAKQRLFGHIFDHKSELASAYEQMDMLSGTPKWHAVKVTSYLINSLNNSNN